MTPCPIKVNSETGRLRAVLLHRPGVEVEKMTPVAAPDCLYGDIMSKAVVDAEYANFSGVLERWAKVYYVEDLLEEVLRDEEVKARIVRESLIRVGIMPVFLSGLSGNRTRNIFDKLMALDAKELTRVLIEGYEDPFWDGSSDDRYLLHPLYNLFFTRDATSTIYNRALVNSMSFDVRKRETPIFEAIYRNFFGVETLCAMNWDPEARTEGGDVQIAAPDLLCLGKSIRTNVKGIEYLTRTFASERDTFHILLQELPHNPESFIHLDMVFTFLGQHRCMVFEPMLKKRGYFTGKETSLISIDHGEVVSRSVDNILEGLKLLKRDVEPVICGGDDKWEQLREQWHSGANFFSLGDEKVLGYRRNLRTIEMLDKAGFSVLQAEDVISGKVSMEDYARFVVTFPASELPRAGGGARCMTMPLLRDDTE